MSEENIPEATPQETENSALAAAVGNIPEVWGSAASRSKHLANIQKSRGILGTKHGMYSGVPMICAGQLCPFRDTCWIDQADLVTGDRCPIEIATIMELYERYCASLQVGDSDVIDQGLVKQLIDTEIMMIRADNKMASSPDLVREVIDAISQKTGDVYTKKEVSPLVALKMDLQNRHHKILKKLQATREDKKDQLLGLQDPSSMAARLIQRVRMLEQQGAIQDADVIDVTPHEEEVKNDGDL